MQLALIGSSLLPHAMGDDAKRPLAAASDLESWLIRRAAIQNQILSAAGLLPLPQSTPLRAKRFGREATKTFAVEKVSFESLEGFRLSGNLYLPLTVTSRLPAVLIAHGHWKNGRIHHAKIYSVPALAATLASRGFVVLTYDMVGYGDTRQLPHRFGDTKREMLWSFGPLGLQLWNSMRALDFLASLDEVDPNRIGMTGFSGGGLQTILLAAIDERVKAVATGGTISATFQGDDPFEQAAGLHIGLSNVEIAAAIAPRPLLLISATRDWTRKTPKVELPAIRSIYDLYGKPQRVENAHIRAWHNGNRESRARTGRLGDRTDRRVG